MTRYELAAGDAVVVAVPLGVLKAGAISFSPPLPLRKQEAIQRLGFGLLNKVGCSCSVGRIGNRSIACSQQRGCVGRKVSAACVLEPAARAGRPPSQ